MKKKVLYLSYNGMMEHLGASQVLSYVYKLSADHDFFLISLEKPQDFKNKEALKDLHKQITSHGIKWYLIDYKTSKIGRVFNFLRFTKRAYQTISKEKIQYIHARSYLPTISCYLIQKIKPVKYLFDTRGFEFDERADVGSISREGFLFKLLKNVEKKLYENASGINKLSSLGKQTILENKLFKKGDSLENITVIPTCVDLNRFSFHSRDFANPLTIGYVGTATGWYDFDKTVITLKKILESCNARFVVLNKGQHDFIRKKLLEAEINESQFSIEEVSFSEMPNRLKDLDVALFYIHPYFSKIASAATKLGELFASGIPVLTNANVGDHQYYIEKYKAGKIIEFEILDTYDFEKIFLEIANIKTSKNCRRVAEKYFSLEKGVENYNEMYSKIFH